jgi:hypothetical protein
MKDDRPHVMYIPGCLVGGKAQVRLLGDGGKQVGW